MGKRIMIVVDDSDTCSTIETLLKRNGYEVVCAVDSEDCLKKLESDKPNLLLISSLMPKEKILENATKIKGLKIAYLTADESEIGHLDLYKNVVGFVDEPRDIDKFLKKIKDLLK